jgi:hypothetical protein
LRETLGQTACHRHRESGDPPIRLTHPRSDLSGRLASPVSLELQRGISDDKVALFEQQLQRRRREHELQGLRWTEIDADALAERLTARLAQVVPEGVSVKCEAGMLWVAGSGVDVARMVSDDQRALEARIALAAEDMLAKASDPILRLALLKLAEVMTLED